MLLSLPGPGGRVEVGAERELQDVVYGDVAVITLLLLLMLLLLLL